MGAYCYQHQILADAKYERPEGYHDPYNAHPSDMGNKHKSKKDKWKDELERDFAKQSTKNLSRKDKKSFCVSPKDFPCTIDGIHFQSIQEYADYFSASSVENLAAEMEGVDRPYDNFDAQTTIDFRDWDKWTPGYIKPKVTHRPAIHMSKNSWRRIDSLAHMRYCVIRNNDGDYFAVWVSLVKDAKLILVMDAVLKTQMPIELPTTVMGCYIHTSYAEKNFRSAEGHFWKGGETLTRIKERYKKAADPNWIPPNLRTLAIVATHDKTVWEYIPVSEHARLEKWLLDGCRGWFGKDPSDNWYKVRGLNPPPKYKSSKSDDKDKTKTQLLLPETTSSEVKRVWDFNLKQWIKKKF